MKQNVYQLNGYYSRADYIRCLSEDYDVPIGTVKAIADSLGPNEDFDALVTTLEDMANMGDMFM